MLGGAEAAEDGLDKLMDDTVCIRFASVLTAVSIKKEALPPPLPDFPVIKSVRRYIPK
jgi:hypothetical protein